MTTDGFKRELGIVEKFDVASGELSDQHQHVKQEFELAVGKLAQSDKPITHAQYVSLSADLLIYAVRMEGLVTPLSAWAPN